MNHTERFLIFLLKATGDTDVMAVLLQSYIQENGPLSEEAAAEVREMLKAPQNV